MFQPSEVYHPKTKTDVISILAESEHHYMMLSSHWSDANNATPCYVRVYKANLREIAYTALANGYTLKVDDMNGELFWYCLKR